MPAVAAKPLKAARFKPPGIGSTWVYAHSDGKTERLERIDNSSWGTTGIVRYRRELDGEPTEIRCYNLRMGTWVVTFDEAEVPIIAADPDDRRYRWPMAFNGYWRSRYTIRDLRAERNLIAHASWRVDGFERISIPGGTTRAIRLASNKTSRDSMVWFAWDIGIRTQVQIFKDGEMVREKTLIDFSPI
ncbi:MAG: hypothetical protein AB8B85_01460 [Paracoccaceae bacterium]